MRNILTAVATLLFLSSSVQAEPISNEKLERFLIGSTSKKWTIETVVVPLGGEDRCEKGHEMTFKSNGTVDERECRDGVLVRANRGFEMTRDDIDVFVTIGTERYRVIGRTFEAAGVSFEEAVLRWESGKDNNTIELILQREVP